MTIDEYLEEIAFCPQCGQSFRENFDILFREECCWHVECVRCSHEFTIPEERLQGA